MLSEPSGFRPIGFGSTNAEVALEIPDWGSSVSDGAIDGIIDTSANIVGMEVT